MPYTYESRIGWFCYFYPNEIQRKSIKSNLDSHLNSILNSFELHVGNSAQFQFGVLPGNSCLLTPPDFRSSAEDLYEFGEDSINYSDSSSTTIIYPTQPVVMSYDFVTKYITMRTTANGNMETITLSIGSLCPSDLHQAYLWHTYSPLGTLGPFVVRENQFYFLLEHSPTHNHTDYIGRHVIEFYVMEDCETLFPRRNTSMEFTQCSRTISVVLNQTFSENTRFVMGNHMTLVITASGNFFLFVLFEFNNGTGTARNCTYTTTTHLYSIHQNGQVKHLHEITLEKCWSPENINVVPGVGSVSYYPGNSFVRDSIR